MKNISKSLILLVALSIMLTLFLFSLAPYEKVKFWGVKNPVSAVELVTPVDVYSITEISDCIIHQLDRSEKYFGLNCPPDFDFNGVPFKIDNDCFLKGVPNQFHLRDVTFLRVEESGSYFRIYECLTENFRVMEIPGFSNFSEYGGVNYHVVHEEEVMETDEYFFSDLIKFFEDDTDLFCDELGAKRYVDEFNTKQANPVFSKVLKEIVGLLDEKDIPYFLHAGTLLGLVRECSFIPHTSDVDIAVLINDWNYCFPDYLIEKGFKIVRSFFHSEKQIGLEYTFSKYGADVDLFLIYTDEEGDYWWNSLWISGAMKKMGFPKFEFRNSYLDDFQVTIPNNYVAHLNALYTQWTVKDDKYKWDSSANNVRDIEKVNFKYMCNGCNILEGTDYFDKSEC